MVGPYGKMVVTKHSGYDGGMNGIGADSFDESGPFIRLKRTSCGQRGDVWSMSYVRLFRIIAYENNKKIDMVSFHIVWYVRSDVILETAPNAIISTDTSFEQTVRYARF